MEPLHLQTDVLVVGSGAAGLMAARAAADEGARVILTDKSLISRGGATILAQMTVAVALGEAEEDSTEIHFEDTMKGSRGLADPKIVRAVVERGPEVILEAEGYGVKWARTPDGKRSQAFAPGHSKARCVYVDILNTGGATAAGLKKAIWKDEKIQRLKNVMITKVVVENGRAVGAIGFEMEEYRPISIAASSVILATGGLTEVFERNSASANMTGDGFVLAAEAGAEVRDMEMVQFFPIAHLFPPLVGIDPIMWDPFRYKLGGRLLNGLKEEFMDKYNGEVAGKYTAARDQTTLAIFREVEAGRGTPHGGAYLDFTMVPEDKLKEAFGPVIDILRNQGVDLTKDMVEVAPMAHFMLGGVRVDEAMRTRVPGLLASGELIYGMHGANRLSGNAITEALVTGRIAGETAAREKSDALDEAAVRQAFEREMERLTQFWHPTPVERDSASLQAFKRKLQKVMWKGAGPLRTESGLKEALTELKALGSELDRISLAKPGKFALSLFEKLEAANMLKVSEAIVLGALERKETRGAHVRLDYDETLSQPSSYSYVLNEAGDWVVTEVPLPAGS
ncbi:FAD-binding protein [Paenibacillus barengoltzii]|jgi:succinate dehydrogenase / fumarate reductase flavoprotein subunit/fumarate reductase (CoM/CoB) subunit A|uniref:Fumarate reductase (CoM/CoB) subunit A n=1 Tax=Paenibacillus barengoltzii J12 TaxID=935846 RepID=A0ABY1LXK7_9BACL|nr:FAD-binding protein [Paenibacillus barengoltzii]MEC2346562.1 FAD-binding protein [Paenibacillus barengoltzii]SMF26929.1 fumarate reductase (CoM/CoB) subunit A [Paenibacillus barengoltzii J12]SMF53652.1 fumarate reductase (CoM/CoB) subunit A [Paenibacillus barengoltzii]